VSALGENNVRDESEREYLNTAKETAECIMSLVVVLTLGVCRLPVLHSASHCHALQCAKYYVQHWVANLSITSGKNENMKI
jgi:hypothetical protein